jgi:hypothetical protein
MIRALVDSVWRQHTMKSNSILYRRSPMSLEYLPISTVSAVVLQGISQNSSGTSDDIGQLP